MSRRIISSSLVILAVVNTWALLRQDASQPEQHAVSSNPDEVAPPTAALEGHLLPATHQEEPSKDTPSALSDPLTRQRARLQSTATRLRARREHARANGTPAITLQALDAHLARVEQRLAALDASG